MTRYFYMFMERLMYFIWSWWHKDVFRYYTVYRDMAFNKDVSKHQEEMDNFRTNSMNKTPHEMKAIKNVQLVLVYHHTIEKDIEQSKRVLETETNESIREWFEDCLKNPKEHWEYTGVNYFYNTLTDRIRRYFQFTCGSYIPLQIRKKKRSDRNFISRHWIDVCDFIERSQTFFSRY